MSKIRLRISVVICILCVIMFLSGSVYALRKVISMDTQKTRSNSEEFLRNNVGNIEEILKRLEDKKREVTINSRHGHKIPIEYLTNDNNCDKLTVVLIHGHSLSLESVYPIADVLLANDINVVVYDQRAHGGNTAKEVTFGYYERDDLADVIDYVRRNMSKKNSIGVLGQSMGASTAGFYSGTEHASRNIDFAILDCPYNNMISIIRETGKRQGYSKLQLDFLLKLGNIANKICMKFFYKDMDVVRAVRNSSVPTLVYEAKNDKTCPYYMADEVFESINHNKKEKIMFAESEHIKGFYKEREKYIDTLLKFINKYRRDEKKT